jgi:acetoin utilization deacetylase AcuC-like enzyme
MGWEWTPQIRNGVLAINAGMIAGAGMAMEMGIAANVAQGFHHAKPERGWYFCTFNGLALVAQEFPEKRIFVPRSSPRSFPTNWGMHESEQSICRHLNPVKDDFTPYRNALEEAFMTAKEWQADLIIYQAGADPHVDDPVSSGSMTTDQLLERDRIVFRFCREEKIPVLFVLAGGYQTPIEEKLLPLHLNTFKAAYEEYC